MKRLSFFKKRIALFSAPQIGRIFFSITLLFLAGSVFAETLEYKVKAGYLYNFTKFVTWPDTELDSFKICILGHDPFGSILDPLEQKKIRDLPVRVIRIPQFEPTQRCQILYIGESVDGAQFQFGDYPNGVLTVSDAPGFSESGGMLGFTLIDGKVRLKINLKACKASGLLISAKLLEVAAWVGG